MTGRVKAILFGGVVAAAAVGLSVGAVMLHRPAGSDVGMAQAAAIGGSFSMRSHDGRLFSDADLRGAPFAIFFGFTHCPDICPSTLADMTDLIERLGDDAERMRFVFVTLDPERDTPEMLGEYLSYFDPRIVGLSGTPEETAKIARAYRVVYERVETSSDYTLNHTATVFLMGADGRLASALNYGEPLDLQFKKLSRLVRSASS